MIALSSILPFGPEPTISVPGDPTVAEVVRLYLQYLLARQRAGDYSAGSLDRIDRKLRSFLKAIGDLRVSACKQHHFTSWWMSHFVEWKSDYTRRDAKDAVLGAFKWAEEEELIERSPFKKPRFRLVTRPRQPMRWPDYLVLMTEAMTCNVRRPARLDLPAFRRRRRKGSLALRKALFFLAHTGARPGEMREAEWRELDEKAGIVTLFEHKTARATGKSRVIGLTPKVLRLLLAMRRNRHPAADEKIFLNADGEVWTKNSFGRHFRRHADRADMAKTLTSYCLRFGFIVQAIENGVGERQVADQVGHATTRMISHYAAASRQNAAHLRRVAEDSTRRKR